MSTTFTLGALNFTSQAKRWLQSFRSQPVSVPKPAPSPVEHMKALDHSEIYVVGLYVHRLDSEVAETARPVNPASLKPTQLVVGQPYIRVAIGVHLNKASERRAMGQRSNEFWYEKQYFIPCKSATIGGWVGEVEAAAQALKAEGRIVEMFTPDQPANREVVDPIPSHLRGRIVK